jgi:hypothetical protein
MWGVLAQVKTFRCRLKHERLRLGSLRGPHRRMQLAACGLLVAVIGGCGGHGGQRHVSPRVLPLAPAAHVGQTFVDCSKVGLVAYNAHRPCDTYFLINSRTAPSPTALLTGEQATLRRAGWRPVPATSFGQDLAAHGWQGPHHRGCAIVQKAATGARAQQHLESKTRMSDGFVAFARIARAAAHTAALAVLAQPGLDSIGRPRC